MLLFLDMGAIALHLHHKFLIFLCHLEVLRGYALRQAAVNLGQSLLFSCALFYAQYNQHGAVKLFSILLIVECYFFIVRKPHVSQKKGDQQQYWELLRILIFHHQAKRGILQFLCQAVQTSRK